MLLLYNRKGKRLRLDGAEFDTSEDRHGWVVAFITFIAMWCQGCRNTMADVEYR